MDVPGFGHVFGSLMGSTSDGGIKARAQAQRKPKPKPYNPNPDPDPNPDQNGPETGQKRCCAAFDFFLAIFRSADHVFAPDSS